MSLYDTLGDLTAQQISILSSGATKPIMIMKILHGASEEYISFNGNLEFDSQSYIGGQASISGMKLHQSASIELNATPVRIGEVQSSRWRNGHCKIYFIIAPIGTPMTFSLSDAIVVLDGKIDSSNYDDKNSSINMKILHRALSGALIPPFRFNQFCNHMPTTGDNLNWGTGALQNVDSPRELVLGTQGGVR